MIYSLYVLPSAQKDLDDLEKKVYERCHRAMLKLAENPRSRTALKLVGEDGDRIRAGDWRILYRIDDTQKKVFVYRIKHLREVYH